MKTILVTGASGFVGQELIKELLQSGNRVIGVSRKTVLANDNPAFKGVKVSNLNELTIENLGEEIDLFIDLAWGGSMGPERGDKELQMENVNRCLANVDVAYNLGAKRYCGVGTITELTALAENAPAGPATVYGLAKNLAHEETKKRALEIGLEHVWLRLGNAYSQYDRSPRFLNSTLAKLAMNEPIELMTGNQPFDFVHISDAVKGISLAAETGESGEVYYVGNGEIKTILEFCEEAKELLFSTSEIKAAIAPIGLTVEDLSVEKLEDLGFKAAIPFAVGVTLWAAA